MKSNKSKAKRTSSNILYLCDPELNTKCSKSNCYKNFEDDSDVFNLTRACRRTTHIEFAKQPIETVTIRLNMTDEDAALLKENAVLSNVKSDKLN